MRTPMTKARTIGWVGLGKLGLPMAARLASSGRTVAGYDRDQDRVALASERGVTPAPAAQAAASSDVVFTSLPDDKALRAALLGDKGLLTVVCAGAVLAETSTVSPEASAEVAEACEWRGVAYLRLPISGSSALAETGMVTCFASGPRAVFDSLAPVLQGFTRAQTYLGEGEEARYAKLAINLMIAVSAGMMAECLSLARKGNIAWSDILNAIGDSAAASPLVKYKLGPLAARDFSPAFTCRQLIKDLDLILDAAGRQNVPVPLAAYMRQTYAAMMAEGEAENDFIAVVRHMERLSGLADPG
jgi:3-hydroxyisobutyrate dehydrogenase-like beta-hydroxyacid dehydrogenase